MVLILRVEGELKRMYSDKPGPITDQERGKAVIQILLVFCNRCLDFVPRPKFIPAIDISPGFRVLSDFFDSPRVNKDS
jgi:hypothetical protein